MKTNLLVAIFVLSTHAACSGTPPLDIEGDAAADHAEVCPPTPTTCSNPKAPPSYAADVRPIIRARCAPCHFPGGISSKIYNLSTYEGVVNATTPIIGQLFGCKMPPIHGNAKYGIEAGTVPGLSSDQRDTFMEWIRCGAPDN